MSCHGVCSVWVCGFVYEFACFCIFVCVCVVVCVMRFRVFVLVFDCEDLDLCV